MKLITTFDPAGHAEVALREDDGTAIEVFTFDTHKEAKACQTGFRICQRAMNQFVQSGIKTETVNPHRK